MIELTLALFLHGHMVGVMPSHPRFREIAHCEAKGRAIARRLKKGLVAEIDCDEVKHQRI
jgi:hypothetical protein